MVVAPDKIMIQKITETKRQKKKKTRTIDALVSEQEHEMAT